MADDTVVLKFRASVESAPEFLLCQHVSAQGFRIPRSVHQQPAAMAIGLAKSSPRDRYDVWQLITALNPCQVPPKGG